MRCLLLTLVLAFLLLPAQEGPLEQGFYEKLIKEQVLLRSQAKDFSHQGIVYLPGEPGRLILSAKHPKGPSRLEIHTLGKPGFRSVLLQKGDGLIEGGVGGLAVAGDQLVIAHQEQRAWIGRLPLAALDAAADGARLVPEWVPVPGRASTCAVHAGQLWILPFVLPEHKRYGPDEASTGVDADGQRRPQALALDLSQVLSWSAGDAEPPVVDRRFIPHMVQGAAFATGSWWYMCSWSTRFAHLTTADGSRTIQNVPLYGEGLAATGDGSLWMAFEGGTPSRSFRLRMIGARAVGAAVRLQLTP